MKEYEGNYYEGMPSQQYYDDVSYEIDANYSPDHNDSPVSDFEEELCSDDINTIEEDEFYAFKFSNEYIK